MPSSISSKSPPGNDPTGLVPHGTLDYAELRTLGLHPEELTFFSSNINPFGPPPTVVTALREAVGAELVARYPDRLNLELREMLALHHNLPMDAILVGNGSADLLWLAGLYYLQNRRVAILGPTFGEYHHIAQIMGAEIVNLCHPGWEMTPHGFRQATQTLDPVTESIKKSAPDVIFLCNPNNPTGHYLAPDALELLYNSAPDALWIIDEAYAQFMQPPATTSAWVNRGNWLILRSMTKDFALGGLRLGYLLGAPSLIAPLQAGQSPWNVNIFAQLAGSVSLREGLTWRAETLANLHLLTAELQEQIWGAGYRPHPTTVNYFLVPVNSATKVRRQLLQHRLVVRDCTSFGMPETIRIATQLPEANARLLEALRQLAATANVPQTA